MLCPCLSSLNCLTLLFFTSLGVGLYLHWSPSMCLAHSSAVSLFDVSNDLVVSLDRWLDGRALWNEMIIRNLLEGCDVASKTPIRFTAAHSGVIRKYRMYGVLGHLGFCLWLRHPRWYNGVLLPVMSGVYLWGYDARLPQVRLSFCLCCVMVEPPFLPASRWAKAS